MGRAWWPGSEGGANTGGGESGVRCQECCCTTTGIYYAQLVEEESTRTVMAGLRTVIEAKGLFCALYRDRGSHLFEGRRKGGSASPHAGGPGDEGIGNPNDPSLLASGAGPIRSSTYRGRPGFVPDLQLAADLPKVPADPEQIQRLLRNLILNAQNAMPHGEAITICTETLPGRIVLEICDTGKGLTTEECERLFTPYYTTKQHGTGLGLAIVPSVVRDHGGTIGLTSAVGNGSAFGIELPRNGSHE